MRITMQTTKINDVTAPPARAQFEEKISAHMGIVRKIAGTYRVSLHDRADLEQDILAALWRAWSTYDHGRPFSTWMYRVALNVAISSHRRELRRRHESLDEAHEEIAGAPDVDFELRQQQAMISRSMADLSATDRALLLLHLEGNSHRGIAEVLGTSEGNVAVKLNRIKTQLRRVARVN